MDVRPPTRRVFTYLNKRFWKLCAIFRRSWFWIWRLVVALFFIDLIIPVIGNKWVPPRASRQPKAPYGLSLVDPQADPTFPPAVDIVFVHGLGAFPDTTWQNRPVQDVHESNSGQSISWIRDLLAQDLREARLMFFNYDSTTYNDAPHKDLRDMAMELLQAFDVSRLRQSLLERNRPIIFLCHSYGGLVLKEALLQAKLAPTEYRDIVQNIRGIIFLGTPHRGTKYSDYARAAALRLNRLNANPDIFLPLKVNSSALLDQHSTFMDQYSTLDIVNFYETRALPFFCYPIIKLCYKGILVEKFSATFENVTNAPIDSHHSGLNKFGSRKDPGYRKVRFALNYMTQTIVKQRIETQIESPLTPQEANSSTESGTPKCPQGARYIIPFSMVNTYTERPNIMEEVIRGLSSPQELRDPPLSVGLWGIGGSGKSQLALRFVEQHKSFYDIIIWIDAQSPVTAIRSYAVAFERLKLNYPQHVLDNIRNEGDLYDRPGLSIYENWVIRAVKESLENTVCKWLVVIDNADNLAWLHDIIPRGRAGSLIITTRDRLVYRFVNHAIHVDRMNTEEALELLFRSANIPFNSRQKHGAELTQQRNRKQQALAIVDELGYLALAINLAGAYISQHELVKEDLSLYSKFLYENSAALLGNEALQDQETYPYTVANVWETSFAAINKTSPSSAQLLTFLAHLSTTHIEDRLFDESSFWRYQQKSAHPGWKAIARTLEILSCFFFPLVCVLLFNTIVPWKPNLRGQNLKTAKIVLSLAPILLDIIGMIVIATSKLSDYSKGNVIKKDSALISLETTILLLFFGIGNAQPIVSQWLLPENEGLSPFRQIALSYATAVGGLWVFEKHMNSLQEEKAIQARGLLDRLDFSHSSIARFFAVIRQLHDISEFSKGWHYVFIIAWIVFWLILLKSVTSIIVILLSRVWCLIVDLLEVWIPNGRLIKFLKVTTSWLGLKIFFGILLVFSLYIEYETRLVAWVPWIHKGPLPLKIPPTLINNLLILSLDGQWNPRTYSEYMAPLTRFGLVQREADSAYSMHVLIRWWARNRLPFAMRQAWARETERFISMSYSSSTCWSDPLCHQMMIPHLIDVANLGVTTGAFEYTTLQDILKRLYRSLKLVGKSFGVASDD